jgi:hypothetical protein
LSKLSSRFVAKALREDQMVQEPLRHSLLYQYNADLRDIVPRLVNLGVPV